MSTNYSLFLKFTRSEIILTPNSQLLTDSIPVPPPIVHFMKEGGGFLLANTCSHLFLLSVFHVCLIWHPTYHKSIAIWSRGKCIMKPEAVGLPFFNTLLASSCLIFLSYLLFSFSFNLGIQAFFVGIR